MMMRALLPMLPVLLVVIAVPVAAQQIDGNSSPLPPISACDFSRLRFSHVDDLFSVDTLCGGPSNGHHDDNMDDPIITEDSVVTPDVAFDMMWTSIIQHGWSLAREESTPSSISLDKRHDTSTNFSGAYGGEVIDREVEHSGSYPFLVCVESKTQLSGNANLLNLLPKIGALSSNVVVLSNLPYESCFIVSASAAASEAMLEGKSDDADEKYRIVPLIDAMKMDQSVSTETCENPEWVLPTDGSITWERALHITLRPDIIDASASKRVVYQKAQKIVGDVREWGRIGNRRRRMAEEEIDKNRNGPLSSRSLTDAFSLTAIPVADDDADAANGHAKNNSFSTQTNFWSRALASGMEADHQCSAMFDDLAIIPRFGNSGYTIKLNQYQKQKNNEAGEQKGKEGSERTASNNDTASNPSCVCSLIAALAAHPMIIDVTANRPVELHNNGYIGGMVQSNNAIYKPFKQAGITGLNEIVGVADTGLDTNHCYFQDRVNKDAGIFGGGWQMNARKVVHYDDLWFDAIDVNSGHGTHVAGTIAGKPSSGTASVGNGVAEDAKLAVFDIAPGAQENYDPGVDRLMTSLYNNGKGAKVINGSWGRSNRGVYSNECMDMDRALALYEDVVYVASAGNSGAHRSIKSPADCKNTISVGASVNYGYGRGTNYMVSYSSRGPTADGRIKPDLVAPGHKANSAASVLSSTGECGFTAWGGTSMASPAAAGAAALVRQYFREGFIHGGFRGSGEGFEPSGALVKAVLLNSGTTLNAMQDNRGNYVSGSLRSYDTNQGFGNVNLVSTLPLDGQNDISAFVVNNAEISDQQILTFNFDTSRCTLDRESMISATLVWYDAAGMSGCQNCLINDLDMWVESPSGKVLYPNGLSQADTKNTAERVRFSVTESGLWAVHVRGTNMAMATQRFSLVASGCFDSDPMPQPKASIDSHLDTTFQGGIKNAGVFFDLVAKDDIEIKSFDIHTPLKTPFNVWVFTTDGTYRGKETTPLQWNGTLIRGVQGRGAGVASVIDVSGIGLFKGETKGIYIMMESQNEVRYTAVASFKEGDVFSENGDVQIIVGAGSDPLFKKSYPQRMANLRVVYQKYSSYAIAETPKPTPQPTVPSSYGIISTMWNGGKRQAGCMFNIRAKRNIDVTSFQVNIASSDLITFQIWERDGGHIGFEQSPSEWTKIGTTRVKGNGDGTISNDGSETPPTTIPLDIFDSAVTIEAGKTKGFYLTTSGELDLRYGMVENKAVGDPFTSNDDLEVQVGTANDYGSDGFGFHWNDRVVNIRVIYKAMEE